MRELQGNAVREQLIIILLDNQSHRQPKADKK